VQIRRSKSKTAGGIILTDEAKDTEKWNTQTAKVISLGPLAFKNREKGIEWVEGQWCKPGDFVRVMKYGGDRWEVPLGKSEEPALFVLFNDLDILGRVTGNPLAVKAFV
jgi:co-chaperonin GroES (HSP10)